MKKILTLVTVIFILVSCGSLNHDPWIEVTELLKYEIAHDGINQQKDIDNHER